MLPADIARAALHTLLAVLIFTDAQALSGFTFNLAELTGPAIATALVLGLGGGWAFLLDAGTFVVSAIFLSRVHTPRR